MFAHRGRAFFTRHVIALTALILVIQPTSGAERSPHPAHVLANRFAQEAARAEATRAQPRKAEAQPVKRSSPPKPKSKSKSKQAPKPKIDPAKAREMHERDMLARARAEAAGRQKLEAEAARLDALRAEREKRERARAQQLAERARQDKAKQIEAARQAELAELAEASRKAEEHMQAAARAAEQNARLAAEAQREAQARQAAEDARAAQARQAEDVQKARAALKFAAARAAAQEAARAEENQRAMARAQEAERRRVAAHIAEQEAEAEIARVADRLARIRQAQLERLAPSHETRHVEPSSARDRLADTARRNLGAGDVPLPPPRRSFGARSLPEASASFDGQVTVLLHMEPRYRRGRRHESMDPVLCTHGGCYVSNGPESPARYLPGHRAVRFGNAIGRRAGACNGALTCIFRNVDLRALPTDLQPVDIRVLRHDRRTPERIERLSRCRVTPNRQLSCTDAVHGDGYTMWVMTEQTAKALPPDVLERALDDPFIQTARADAGSASGDDRW